MTTERFCPYMIISDGGEPRVLCTYSGLSIKPVLRGSEMEFHAQNSKCAVILDDERVCQLPECKKLPKK